MGLLVVFFFFQAEDGIRDGHVTGVQTCALPISAKEEFDNAPYKASRASTFEPSKAPKPSNAQIACIAVYSVVFRLFSFLTMEINSGIREALPSSTIIR